MSPMERRKQRGDELAKLKREHRITTEICRDAPPSDRWIAYAPHYRQETWTSRIQRNAVLGLIRIMGERKVRR